MKNKFLHKELRLNGRSFMSANDIVSYAKLESPKMANFLSQWFSNKETISVQTSGSTGKPKQIELRKEHMKNSAVATGMFFDLKEQTKALCCLPIDFIAGKMMLVRAMVLGWHIDIVEANSHPLEDITKEYDFSAMVPMQVGNSLSKLYLVKTLIVGGGVVSERLQNELQNLSTKIYATYGMTETITHIAVKKINSFIQPELISKSHYQLLPNITISLDDRDCLVITAPTISDEMITTNDVVEIHSENEFEWKGRYDNVINSGGIKLFPEEIEKKIAPHISCRFFVAGIPDEGLGEKLILIIEENQNAITTNELKKITALEKYEIPKEVYYVDHFVETETQKIQRKKTLAIITH